MSRPTGDDARPWSGTGRAGTPPHRPAPGPPERASRFAPDPGSFVDPDLALDPRVPRDGRAPRAAADNGDFGPPTWHGDAARRPRATYIPPADNAVLAAPRVDSARAPITGTPRAYLPGSYGAAANPPAGIGADGRPVATEWTSSWIARSNPSERGLPGWAALLVFLVICLIGGLVDVSSGSKVRGAFNVAIVVAGLVSILFVKRRSMFPVVVAPPLVYLGASAVMLFARGGIHNRQAIYDEATNWLVYGFPAIAGATAAVLLVAGIRLIINK